MLGDCDICEAAIATRWSNRLKNLPAPKSIKGSGDLPSDCPNAVGGRFLRPVKSFLSVNQRTGIDSIHYFS